MNKFLLFTFISISFLACQPGDDKNNKSLLSGDMINNPAQIQFDTTFHDFGKMTEGEKVTYDFKFKNISKNPMVIVEVHASCGCTTPFWPKEIIKPGQSNVIKVQYDSEGHPGKFAKNISVTANTNPNISVLNIMGEVIPK